MEIGLTPWRSEESSAEPNVKEVCEAYNARRQAACNSWSDRRDELKEMVLANHDRDSKTTNPGLDSVAVFLSDTILIATGHPDQEGEPKGESCLVLLPLSEEMLDRLSSLSRS